MSGFIAKSKIPPPPRNNPCVEILPGGFVCMIAQYNVNIAHCRPLYSASFSNLFSFFLYPSL